MPRRLRPLLLALLLAPVAGGVRAQGPEERSRLDAFRDSLAAVRDTSRLLADERALALEARARRADALLQLRLGFVALRLGDLGKRWRYDAARDAFRRAGRLAPGWPYPPYGEALAAYGVSESRRNDPANLTTTVGIGPLRDAVALLATAVARDPGFAPALTELGRLPLRLRDSTLWAEALDALRRRAPAARERPAVLLALGRLEREAGSLDSAAAAFRGYLAAGGTPGLGRLELARTLLTAGDPAGDSLYYAAAASDDSATVAGLRADLRYIVADSALRAFDAARGAARAAVLRLFWADRDALALRTPGERLREHYRRLAYAHRHFTPSITRRPKWPGCAYFPEDGMELDDRGIVYVRHGEPTERIRSVLPGMMPNESWRYARADGDLLLHFGAGVDITDYRLQASVIDLLGGMCSAPAGTRSGQPPPWEIYRSRDSLDPIYGRISAWWGSWRAGDLVRREREIGSASIAAGTTTDDDELRFARPLPVSLAFPVVGAEGDRRLVHVVFAIPGAAARPDTSAGAARYPLRYLVRLRAAAIDAAGHAVLARDTTLALVTGAPVPAGAWLFGRIALAVPTGVWRFRAALQLGDSAGVVLPTDTLRVPPLAGAGAGPRLSDLVLGWRRVPLTWLPATGDTVYFSPFHEYRPATELELYYEVYGMPIGAAYRTELTVTSARDDGRARGRPALRLAFDARAGGAVASGRRTLSLATLAPGRYRLDVAVQDAGGRRDAGHALFTVVRP